MKKQSGQEAGEANAAAFDAWAAGLTDGDFRSISRNGKINRSEIVRACGFARAVLQQNPRVAASLRQLEDGLRSRGVLPPLAVARELGEAGIDEPEPLRERGQAAAGSMAARLKALESQVDALRAENIDLKRRLKRFEALEGVLGRTGRLPR